MLAFEPLYFKEKLTVVNPHGFIGLVTLWSSPSWVIRQLERASVDLSHETSPIAVIGTLYGNGFRQLIRNLLFNPQIRMLVCCGRNRTNSLEDLLAFFDAGIEEVEGSSPFFLDGIQTPAARIKGAKRIIDALVRPEDFENKPEIVLLGELRDDESLRKAKEFFGGLNGIHPQNSVGNSLQIRKEVPLPSTRVEEHPSNPGAFVVAKREVIKAWEELIFVIYRFGHITHLQKGDRKELQNIKVVVEEPSSEPDPHLFNYWFTEDKIKQYQREILSAEKYSDVSYSYGHRIRSYFGKDTLEQVAQRLAEDREDRKCFISLWDTASDLNGQGSHPCLVTVFFRFFGQRLTMTATYRTHNALDAWIYNFYGLKVILDYVAQATGLEPGRMTIISHSISIDVNDLSRAALLVERSRHFAIELDPHGEFAFSVDHDSGEIIVHHYYKNDLLIKEYRGKSAELIQHQLYRDMALSDLNHAMYVGRQLAMAEAALKQGSDFVQG